MQGQNQPFIQIHGRWISYDTVDLEVTGFAQFKVNHKLNFVISENKAHTQKMKNFHDRPKGKIKNIIELLINISAHTFPNCYLQKNNYMFYCIIGTIKFF